MDMFWGLALGHTQEHDMQAQRTPNQSIIRHYIAAVQRTRRMSKQVDTWNFEIAQAHEMQVAQRMGAAEWNAYYAQQQQRTD
jgi:hypothetical protein